MDKLSREISQVAGEGVTMETEKKLQETAKKWASFSLDSFKDELLIKALKISSSIAEFVDEWETCNDESKRM